MYIPITNVYQFRDHFSAMGRGKQFSYEGLGRLYDFLDENSEGYEIDVIAICCYYAEDTFENVAAAYNIDLAEAIDGMCTASAYGLEQVKRVIKETVLDYLQDHTMIVGVTGAGNVVYQQF